MNGLRLQNRLSEAISQATNGAVAGFLATVPMTVLMGILFEHLPRRDRYPLPPWQGTRKVLLEASKVSEKAERPDNQDVTAATAFTHFGYGAASGAAYALTASRWSFHPALKGLIFGLGVWSLSYLGWMPALGLIRPVNERSVQRNALMLVANMVWGLVTGLILGRVKVQKLL